MARCRSWVPLPGQIAHDCMPEVCSEHWGECRHKLNGPVRCSNCWSDLSDPKKCSAAVRKKLLEGDTLPSEVLGRLTDDPDESVSFYAQAREVSHEPSSK